jgi:hypothetical protein
MMSPARRRPSKGATGRPVRDDLINVAASFDVFSSFGGSGYAVSPRRHLCVYRPHGSPRNSVPRPQEIQASRGQSPDSAAHDVQSRGGSGDEQAKAEFCCIESDEVAVAFGPPA